MLLPTRKFQVDFTPGGSKSIWRLSYNVLNPKAFKNMTPKQANEVLLGIARFENVISDIKRLLLEKADSIYS